MSTAATIIKQTEYYKIYTKSIQSVKKLSFSHLSVCLRNALSIWLQMTSHNVTFIDVTGVSLNQNRDAVFIWSVDMCFIFIKQINLIFMQPIYKAVILCDCIIS